MDGMGYSGLDPSSLQRSGHPPLHWRPQIPDNKCKGIVGISDALQYDGVSDVADGVSDGQLYGVQTNEQILRCSPVLM